MKPMATMISLVQKGHSSTPEDTQHTQTHTDTHTVVSGPAGRVTHRGPCCVWSRAYPDVNSTSEEELSITRLQSRLSVISLYYYNPVRNGFYAIC